jgi:mono/diheme cytochrome c family protein
MKCHATWGVGGKVGPDLTRVGMGKSLLQIAGALWNHSPRMFDLMKQRGVSRPVLTSEEMSDFLSYLYYLNYYNEPGNAISGQRLFSQKGCASCHSIDGKGGRTGPALDNYRKSASALFVAQAMWNHGPQMSVVMQATGIKKPYLKEREAADLLAFVRGQTPADIPDNKFMLPGSPATGKRLFAEKGCARCHLTQEGNRPGKPNLSKMISYKSVAEIAGAMWNHGPQIWAEMQRAGVPQPHFNGNEMADVLAYLYFQRYTDGPGDRISGKRLFAGKGCAECHSPQSLGASAALASANNLMAAMWNHAPAMEKLAKEKSLAWPAFEGNEMRDLIEYVKSSIRSAKPVKR